jgi:hypothetical protein
MLLTHRMRVSLPRIRPVGTTGNDSAVWTAERLQKMPCMQEKEKREALQAEQSELAASLYCYRQGYWWKAFQFLLLLSL